MSLGLYSLAYPSLGLMYGAPRTNYGFLLFDYAPNTRAYMREVFTWKTDILEAQDGTEQRRAMRSLPRRSFDYGLTLSGQDALNFESLAYGSPQFSYATPVWTDGATLTAPAAIDTDTLMLDPANLGFWSSGYILIYQDQTKYEFARLANVLSDRLILTETTFYAWPEGALVYPIIFSRLAMPINTTWFDQQTLDTNITLDAIALDSYNNLPTVAAPATYNGLEVLEARHNWISDPSFDTATDYRAIDSGVGVFARVSFKRQPMVTRNFKWHLDGRAAIQAFRAFIARRMGRLKPFYLARTLDDFVLATPIADDAVDIVVQGQHYPFYVGANKGREHIAITLLDGTKIYKQVTAASVSSGNTILTINAAIGFDVAPEDVLQIAWLVKSRLAADEVTIEWWKPDFAEADTPFVSVL